MLKYFIPTDEHLDRYIPQRIEGQTEEAFRRLEKYRGDKMYKLYGVECKLDNTNVSVVRQHHDFIQKILIKLKVEGWEKVVCTIGLISGNIQFFFGLGLDDPSSFELNKKYFNNSINIFDWGRYFTEQQFVYRDKLSYYNYISDKPTFTSGHVPPFFRRYNPNDLILNEIYLLKDIRGSGGGNIYPIQKIMTDGIDNVLKLMPDNTIQPYYQIEPEQADNFFVQQFIHPVTIQGWDVLKHLLLIDNDLFTNEEYQKYSYRGLYPSLIDFFNERFGFVDDLNILHKILFTVAPWIQHKQDYRRGIITPFGLTYLISAVESILEDGLEVEIETRINETYPGMLDGFKLFLRLIKIFSTDKYFMLKFRRPYLHTVTTNGITRIKSPQRFDIDIIFDFDEDLSITNPVNPELKKFKQFISNYSASNSNDLDKISYMINPTNGIFNLFNIIFTREQRDSLLIQEERILDDLKSSISLKEEFKMNPIFKRFIKHYANDYIIDRNGNLFMLEVNDSPIIQKNIDEFIEILFRIIKPFYFDKKYLKEQDIDSAKQKYIKYKNKYLTLKKKLLGHL